MSSTSCSSDVTVMLESQQIGYPQTRTARNITLRPSVPVKIGRASKDSRKDLTAGPDNGLFDCAVMSRTHAELTLGVGTGNVYIMDSYSMHGTYLNEEKIRPHEKYRLHSGNHLRFGGDVEHGTALHKGLSTIVTILSPPESEKQHHAELRAGPTYGLHYESDPSDFDYDQPDEELPPHDQRAVVNQSLHALRDYESQLALLEEQNKERLQTTRVWADKSKNDSKAPRALEEALLESVEEEIITQVDDTYKESRTPPENDNTQATPRDLKCTKPTDIAAVANVDKEADDHEIDDLSDSDASDLDSQHMHDDADSVSEDDESALDDVFDGEESHEASPNIDATIEESAMSQQTAITTEQLTQWPTMEAPPSENFAQKSSSAPTGLINNQEESTQNVSRSQTAADGQNVTRPSQSKAAQHLPSLNEVFKSPHPPVFGGALPPLAQDHDFRDPDPRLQSEHGRIPVPDVSEDRHGLAIAGSSHLCDTANKTMNKSDNKETQSHGPSLRNAEEVDRLYVGAEDKAGGVVGLTLGSHSCRDWRHMKDIEKANRSSAFIDLTTPPIEEVIPTSTNNSKKRKADVLVEPVEEVAANTDATTPARKDSANPEISDITTIGAPSMPKAGVASVVSAHQRPAKRARAVLHTALKMTACVAAGSIFTIGFLASDLAQALAQG